MLKTWVFSFVNFQSSAQKVDSLNSSLNKSKKQSKQIPKRLIRIGNDWKWTVG